MPFSKSKSGPSPLQRLSDQRRKVVLGGLAVGAVLGGAIFRRKRRGGEAEFGSQGASSSVVDSGPLASVDVPAPASAPEATEPLPEAVEPTAATGGADADQAAASTDDASGISAEMPINAGTAVDSDDAEAPAPAEPATGELSAEEASVLSVLAQNGRADEDRTTIAVATSLERETTDVAAVLRKLGSEGVVAGDVYTPAGDKIWAVTERGVRRLGAQH
jgi:hypothetical protein